VEGAHPADADHKEWELFDCEGDPLELFNVYHEAKYREVRERMAKLLEEKMMEVGDEMVHDKERETDNIDKEVRRKSSMLGRFWGGSVGLKQS
jgi:uncharacterized membrane protein